MSLTGFVSFKPLTEDEKAQAATVLRRALDLGVRTPVICVAIWGRGGCILGPC